MWDADAQSYKNTGLPSKGDKGDPFRVGGSFDTLAELEAAFPNGDDNISYLVDDDLHVWDGSQWKPIESKIDLDEYQLRADDNLFTTAKTVVGAINENFGRISLLAKPNQLINSNYCIWQRASSYAVANTANYGGPDRWKYVRVSGSPVISRLTGTSGLQCTGGAATMTHTMDAYDFAIVQGKLCTLSYKLNGIIQKKQITPSSTTVVSLSLANGDKLEWVKLELGGEATAYAPRSYQAEYNACLEYGFMMPPNFCTGTWYSGSNARLQANFLQSMRIPPTVTAKTITTDIFGIATIQNVPVVAAWPSKTGCVFLMQASAADATRVGKLGSNQEAIWFDAEL